MDSRVKHSRIGDRRVLECMIMWSLFEWDIYIVKSMGEHTPGIEGREGEDEQRRVYHLLFRHDISYILL